MDRNRTKTRPQYEDGLPDDHHTAPPARRGRSLPIHSGGSPSSPSRKHRQADELAPPARDAADSAVLAANPDLTPHEAMIVFHDSVAREGCRRLGMAATKKALAGGGAEGEGLLSSLLP